MINCNLRQATSDDIPFIYATWLNSYRYDSDLGKGCRNSVFFTEYREVIDRLLNKEDVKVLVACSTDDSTVVYGYLVYEPLTIHYSFVKEAFRKLQIAKMLVKEGLGDRGQTVITHKTSQVEPILRTHQEFVFNPFKLFIKESK